MLIKLGISACLLGERVRYDGGDRRDGFLAEELGRRVEYVAVCPEVGCGLPVPREAMRLTGDPASPRLVTMDTGIDHTERLLSWASVRLKAMEAEGVRGFIFKARSPSCGVKEDMPGLFARAFMERFPMLPVIDEEGIHDPEILKGFINRTFGG